MGVIIQHAPPLHGGRKLIDAPGLQGLQVALANVGISFHVRQRKAESLALFLQFLANLDEKLARFGEGWFFGGRR